MFPTRPSLVIVLLLTVLLVAPAAAQQYHFRTYSELDGLLSGRVYDMAQAADGSMWFATDRGLSRYDSVHWQDVGPRSELLRFKTVFVGRDHQDRMWTVARDMRLHVFVFEHDLWREMPPPPDDLEHKNYIAHVLGRTPDGGDFLAMVERHGRIVINANGEWLTRQIADDVGEVNAATFAAGRLVVATSRGLATMDPADWQVENLPSPGEVRALCPEFAGDGLIAIGNDWVARGRPERLEVMAEGLDLKFDVPAGGTSAQAGRSGGIYFGDQAQVYFFHPHYGLERLSRASGLQSAGVTGFLLDREGNIWVSGLRGVSKLVNRGLAGYDKRHGLFDDEVSAILQRSNGQMVLGHLGGLTIMGQTIRRVNFASDNPIMDRVGDLAEDRDHHVWFAANNLGVGRLNDDSVSFLPNGNGRLRGSYTLQFDQQGDLWIGTNLGLFRWQGAALTQVDFSDLVDDEALLVRRLVLARDGSLLIVSGHLGLLSLRDGNGHWYRPADGSPACNAYTVLETGKGTLLVGTVGGLCVAAGDSLLPAGAPWPSIERPVYGITVDRLGRYWFGTDNGVLRWDGHDLIQLTNQDGLLGTETNRAALKLDRYGDMWIGTNRGLTVYREDFNRAPLAPPLVRFTGFDVDGVRFGPDSPVRVSRPPQSLTAIFQGTTFRDENRASYLTWLENFEEQWRAPEPNPLGQVRYTHTPAGEYVFHVRMRAADGTLSEEAASPVITIQPPLASRWWFRLVLAGAVLFLLWIVAQSVSSRRYAHQLEDRVRDRTAELEASEEKLRAESQRLATTLASISDGVVALDDQGCIALCNPAMVRFWRRSEAELMGCCLSDFVTLNISELAAAQSPATQLLTLPGGIQVWFEISASPVRNREHEIVGTVLAFRDITMRREIEDQRIRTQQLESLGVLAGGIAHDFNNLLTVILGNVSLVEESPGLGSEELGRLDRIKAATENARSLTGQFLTFAKGGEPELGPVSLDQAVGRVCDLVFGGGPVSCELDLDAGLWPVVADRGQLAQVLNNLLLNARQAMNDSGKVLVRARNVEQPGTGSDNERWVALEVQDEGVGIAAANLEHIFDPYFSTKEKGSGLGLAIAHSIVRRHGGRLSVTSDPGRGTVFSLVLPAAHALEPESMPPATADVLPPGRILVLDDEEEILGVYERLLAGLGLAYKGTTDGEQTVQTYEAARASGEGFDGVIMDLTIPGGTGGREAVRKLLDLDPQARVIVASGYSNDPVLANPQDFGFQGALKKPFDKAALREALTELLTG